MKFCKYCRRICLSKMYNSECCVKCHNEGKDFKEEMKMEKEYAKKYNSW